MNPLERVALVGAACRLPGAPDEDAFARLLMDGHFVVANKPIDRWNVERFLHSRTSERGFSYTFAGGYLPTPYDFDPVAFGMSPREAAQVDPQQRLLAEVVWEALEDARLPASAIAGTEVGVYVGVSALDHGSLFGTDPGAIESHFMTGNTLSIVANRISYLFDLRGPSFVVDTACSSSLVAVDRAVSDLLSGRIETAIVAGVNMLLSPAAFIGFSRASMLSPTGVCRPFSADGDGYVRAEGAVAFVLRRSDIADISAVRAYIAASGTNSDGRTSGIALPGLHGQKALLRRVYDMAELEPDDIAFVEAHGTGTVVGDPVEAQAIGEVVARGRSAPLPIGSVKSNIGHLEPASGVAGMMKALLALESRHLPATLHLHRTNPHIDFAALNLLPASKAIDLDPDADVLHCGVSSFGFGGTNAHVILRSTGRAIAPVDAAEAGTVDQLVISAACKDALAALAKRHAALLDAGASPSRVAEAVANGRQLQRHRAVLPVGDARAMSRALEAFAAGGKADEIAVGTAGTNAARTCFVYSGNGAQWVGMGRTALAQNSDFAEEFARIDAAFRKHGLEPLAELLATPDLEDRIGQAAVVQPLLFAIQASLTHALGVSGLHPDIVVGHSVGELAAAYAAGILDLDDAVCVLQARATCQEVVRGTGLMAAFAADRTAVARFLAELGSDDVAIAADNGPSSVTVTGGTEAVLRAMKEARRNRLAGRLLDIDYPYHSNRLDGIRSAFLDKVGKVAPGMPRVPMISTVLGESVGERLLDADYWWHNLRSEVLFRRAIEVAATEGAELFVEIGPRAILTAPVAATLEERGTTARAIFSLSEADDNVAESGLARDPVRRIIARAIANGHAPGSRDSLDGRIDRTLKLPLYPWQRKTFRTDHTSEALGFFDAEPLHPLIGARLAHGVPEWRTLLDTTLVPYLEGHRVGGEIVVPATALVEMALAVARALSSEGPVSVEDFDILQALVLPPQGMREISVRYSEPSAAVEIFSRPRFGPDEWTLHARGHLCSAPRSAGVAPAVRGDIAHDDADMIYATARETGIDYGASFSLFRGLRRDNDEVIAVTLAPADPGTGLYTKPQIIHPASLDAAFHGLFDFIVIDSNQRKAWVPIRFDRLSVWRDGAAVTGAVIVVDRSSAQSKTVTLWLTDENGEVVARLDRALLRPIVLSQGSADDAFMHMGTVACGIVADDVPVAARLAAILADQPLPPVSDGWLLLRAHLRATAHAALSMLSDEAGRLDLDALVRSGRIAPRALPVAHLLVEELRAAGAVEAEGADDRLVEGSAFPDADIILSTFAAEYPLAATDLVLSAHAAAVLPAYLETGESVAQRPAILAHHDARALLSEAPSEALLSAVRALIDATTPQVPHVLIAEPGSSGIIAALLSDCIEGRLRVTVASTDVSALERVVRRLPENSRVETRDLSVATGAPDADVAVLLMRPYGSEQPDGFLPQIAARLKRGGGLLIGLPATDPVVDFQHCMASGDMPLPLGAPALRHKLEEAGCGDVRSFGDEEGGAMILLASAPPPPDDKRPESLRIVTIPAADGTAEALAKLVEQRGGSIVSDSAGDILCLLARTDVDDRKIVEQAIATIRAELLAASRASKAPRLWVATTGLMDSDVRPVADAVWAVGRVAINEFAGIETRLLDLDGTLTPAEAAVLLCEALATPGREREVHLGRTGSAALRVHRGLPAAARQQAQGGAMTLDFPRRGMLENFQWVGKPRVAPGPGEIEIEILASGLNFRDVMLAMGLLNDDVLDDGMAGAVYGFECSGRVLSVGEDVTTHRAGDLVFGFGKEAFATHVTGPAQSFAPLPECIPAEAGATIPVAFYTAWYSLVEMARLAPGEKVLIHGGAGSVGLAAIQIARAIGAEIIATVSTPDKQAIARLYGADHVFDSRSLDFADRIRALGGVDVVLNSLAGEAMRAGLKCLKPFGRFVELGKRDYVGNTQIGLRPFRRNLSYFGVDVDQLLAIDPAITARGLDAIVSGFVDGRYIPLPVMLFEAYEIGSAFRLMQSAGHVGKIVVRPPALRAPDQAPREAPTFAPGDGVQLVVGGTQGFGLATAFWLAENGATRIVVASRRGEVADEQLPRIEALRAQGIVFDVECVDAASASSVDGLVERIVKAHGAITGVFHAAMVLDDALIADLAEDRTSAVLAPKIDGVRNLDRATRSQPIERFMLFSSASTLIGNPGQAAYVAANGYLQGFARKRRSEGLPALAVGWGAIADVGVLAQRHETQESLKRLSGVAGMQSRDALAMLGRILPVAENLPEPIIVCAEFQREDVFRNLPILSSPGFAEAFGGPSGTNTEHHIDLAAQIAGASDVEAQRILTRIIVEEVAQILRLSANEIVLDSPLDALGMDSLMALELRMSLETRYNIELPVMSITSVGNLRDLARRLLQSMRPEEAEGERGDFTHEERELIAMHSNRDPVVTHFPLQPSPVSFEAAK